MALFAMLIGCATHDAVTPRGGAFILIRHAEKALDDPRDPRLSDAGRQRAERIVSRLHGAPVVAVYATPFRRTQQTAEPTALDHRLKVTTYDPSRPATDFATQLRDDYRSGTVLVVGHSNTIPALAHALCGCAVEPIAEGEFDRVITIRVLPDGRAVLDDRSER